MSALSFTVRILTGNTEKVLLHTAPPDQTVESLIGSLNLEGVIPQVFPNSCIVMFGNSLVAMKQTLQQIFSDFPEPARTLTILLLPEQARWALLQLWKEMLESRFASVTQLETAFDDMPLALEEFDDEDTELAVEVDFELGIPEQPPSPVAEPPSATSEGPIPPALRVTASAPKLDEGEQPPKARKKARGTGVFASIGKTFVEFKKGVRGVEDEEEAVASRRATVRYYDRMNPEYVFPLLVALTQKEVKQIVQKRVAQDAIGPFTVKLDRLVEVEPILPGCTCHPAKQTLKLSDNDATLTFWVVPHVLGKVRGATVAIRQEGETIASVPLKLKVTKRTAALVMGIASLVMPFLSSMAKRFGIDFERDGSFDVYLSILNTIFKQIPPMAFFVGGAVLTLALWWMTRPRKRDMFWDVETK